MRARPKYPVTIKDGGESVTIRQVTNRGRTVFRLEYYVAGKRRLKMRADSEEAHQDAARILAMLNERAPNFAQTEDATIFRAAQTVLDGVASVDEAARVFAVATAKLGGVPITEAVDYYLKHRPEKTGKKIPEILEEYLASVRHDLAEEILRDCARNCAASPAGFPATSTN